MIRILNIIRTMNLGGAQMFIMNVYRNIDRNEIQFDFLLNEEGILDDEIRQMGGKIFYMPYLTKIGQIKYEKELIKFFNNHKEYKIVHSHINQVSGIILQAAKKSNVPVRIAHSHSTNNTNLTLVKIYKKYLQQKINKAGNYKFACSKEAGNWLYKNNEFEIIKNGIDTEKFMFNDKKRKQKRIELNIDSNCILIGNVGRFSQVKNHVFLLEIFKKFKENHKCKLLLIGEGELKNNIIDKAKKDRIYEDIIFKVEKEHIEDFYNAMDVYVAPSLYEGIPLTLIEAQTNGVPILASNTIDNNVNISKQIIFKDLKTNRIEEWCDEIEKLYIKGREDNLQKIVQANYDIKAQANKLQAFYKKTYEELEENKK